jgi:hypothetical protein
VLLTIKTLLEEHWAIDGFAAINHPIVLRRSTAPISTSTAVLKARAT